MWATGEKQEQKNTHTGHVIARRKSFYWRQPLAKTCPVFSLSSNESWRSTRFPQFYISLSFKNFSCDVPTTDFAQELIQACLQVVQQWKSFPLKQRPCHIPTFSTGLTVYSILPYGKFKKMLSGMNRYPDQHSTLLIHLLINRPGDSSIWYKFPLHAPSWSEETSNPTSQHSVESLVICVHMCVFVRVTAFAVAWAPWCWRRQLLGGLARRPVMRNHRRRHKRNSKSADYDKFYPSCPSNTSSWALATMFAVYLHTSEICKQCIQTAWLCLSLRVTKARDILSRCSTIFNVNTFILKEKQEIQS